MRRLYFILFLFAVLFNCKSPTEPKLPKFIVSSFNANVWVDKCSDSDSMCTYVNYFFTYYFKNQSGSIFEEKICAIIDTIGICQGVDITPGTPTPVDELQQPHGHSSLVIEKDLSHIDSLWVTLYLEGVFWYKENDKSHTVDHFEHTDSLKIEIK